MLITLTRTNRVKLFYRLTAWSMLCVFFLSLLLLLCIMLYSLANAHQAGDGMGCCGFCCSLVIQAQCWPWGIQPSVCMCMWEGSGQGGRQTVTKHYRHRGLPVHDTRSGWGANTAQPEGVLGLYSHPSPCINVQIVFYCVYNIPSDDISPPDKNSLRRPWNGTQTVCILNMCLCFICLFLQSGEKISPLKMNLSLNVGAWWGYCPKWTHILGLSVLIAVTYNTL